MKRIFKLAAVLLAGALAVTSCYDDSELKDRMDKAESAISKLQTAVEQLNNDYKSLNTIVSALNDKVYVESVTGSAEAGYTIKFTDGKTVTIANGKDGKNGKDGESPVISIAQFTDGQYYWVLDGAWMKDSKGNMIQAQGVTPKVKVEGDYWFISTDDGANWQKMGIASSAEINTVFSKVEETASQVVFYLTDGSTIVLDKYAPFSFKIDVAAAKNALDVYEMSGDYFEVVTLTIPYTMTGADDETEIGVITGAGNPYVVTPANANSGTIKIYFDKYDTYATDAYVYASNSSTSVIRKISFGGQVFEVESAEEGIVVDEEGGLSTITLIAADDVEVEIPEDVTWIRSIATRSIEMYKSFFEVDPNTSVEPRSAVIKLTSGETTKEVTVLQKGAVDTTKGIQARYLGNRMLVYDSSNWEYTTFDEYYITFQSGADMVKLALNTTGAETPAFPTGTFKLDEDGNHAAGTYSVAAADKYHSCLVIGEKEVAIVEGTVTVAEESGVYTITANVVDEAEASHTYTYTGAISIKDDSKGLGNASATFSNQYNTFHATGANEWSVTLQFAKGSPISYLTLDVFGESGYLTNEQGKNLPLGRFEFEEAEEWSTGMKNGNLAAHPYTFTFSGNDTEYNYITPYAGYLCIDQNEDGTYNFEIDLKGNLEGTGDIRFAQSINNVAIDVDSESRLRPCPDQDTEFTTFMNCTGIYFGQPYAEIPNSSVLLMSYSYLNGNYTVNLPLVENGTWEFSGNGASASYCIDPVPAGTYTFANTTTPTANSIANLKKTATYSQYILSDYTGTRLYINGGSVTISAESVTFNVTAAKADGSCETAFTGTVNYSVTYGFRNRATATYQARVPWATE